MVMEEIRVRKKKKRTVIRWMKKKKIWVSLFWFLMYFLCFFFIFSRMRECGNGEFIAVGVVVGCVRVSVCV